MNNSYTTSGLSNRVHAFLVFFIALCSIRFYDFVPETMGKAIVLLADLLIIGFLLLFIVYGEGKSVKRHFSTEILMIFSSFIISSFAALLFHEQPITVTLYAQFAFYTFFFYFLLSNIEPDPDKIVKLFLWLGYLYAVIYFMQYLVYPTQLVSSKVLIDRGTVRIGMPGAEYMMVSWFILLNRYFNTKKIINILGLIPFVVIIIILATRQLLATTVLITFIQIILSKQLKSKISVFIMIALATIPFYFLFQDIFNEIISVSKKQQSDIGENIRLLAARFFMYDLNHNPLWIITGNGFPGPHSEYGVYLNRISKELGYYMSDVGIIGDFAKFGILYAIAELSLIFRLILFKHHPDFMFLRYIALMMLMTLFTGAGFGSGLIIQMCFFLYLIDKQIEKRNETAKEKVVDEYNVDETPAKEELQPV